MAKLQFETQLKIAGLPEEETELLDAVKESLKNITSDVGEKKR